MDTYNEEDLVSVDNINNAIEEFIGKHPENISTWVDGKTVTIQLSNSGIRDKLFSRLAYLVENTNIENDLILFNMPAKCVYASNQIIRFNCTVNELISSIKEYNEPSKDAAIADVDHLPNTVPITRPIKKFYNRLTGSNTLKKAQSIINKSSHKIKVYFIGNRKEWDQGQDENGNDQLPLVGYEVIDIIEIDANTTWNDESLIQKIDELRSSINLKTDGDYGVFNINFNESEKSKIVNNVYIGQLPEFVFDSSIKVGDIIYTRDYPTEDMSVIDNDGDAHQADISNYDFQRYYGFRDQYPQIEEIDIKPYGETLIPNGAIIII